jgi:hypothetical protein
MADSKKAPPAAIELISVKKAFRGAMTNQLTAGSVRQKTAT